MPTLNWIGKEAVVNHHNEVPFRLLKRNNALSVGEAESGNLLVQGDNLEALKALLPYYAGKVKCIYIDPPYNTGNETWVYNDNVNSQEMKNWLGKVVGREGEDLSRSDKWLCMMYPRLSMLKEFLREDGIIIVSIDDFEAYRLRSIMDEIFGPSNFIAQLVWDKTRKNDAKLFSVGHEYLLIYANSLSKLRELKTVWREQQPGAKEIIDKWRSLKNIHGEEYQAIQDALREWYKSLQKGHPSKKMSRYKWVDKYGPWRDRDISWPGGGGPRYDVIHPITGKPCTIPESGWRFATVESMQRQIDLGLVMFRENHSKPPFRKAHLLPVPEENQNENTENEETYENDNDAGLLVMPSVMYKQAQVSVKLLRKIFDGKKVFSNPKDHEILMRLIRYVTGPNDIILDSFAGSGSTGHAVLQINKEEQTCRRFVLIEMIQNISCDVTAERIKRIVHGVNGIEPLGGGFSYVELGPTLFDAEGQIRKEVSFNDLARHVYFTETGEPLPKTVRNESPLIGVYKNTGIYLLYNGILKDKTVNGGNVLTSKVLAQLPEHNGPKVIYGTACRLSSKRLHSEGIQFRQTPYEIRIS